MLKGDLLRRLKSDFPEYTTGDLKDVVDLVFEQMCQAMCQCRRIEIRGFGSFSVHNQKERVFVNPKNGFTTRCPKRQRIVFRPGKNLKRILPNSQEQDIPS